MKPVRQALLFASLLGFWLLLSARFDPLFLAMGTLAAGVVTLASTRLLERTIGPAGTHPRVVLPRLVVYSFWLSRRMFSSAVLIAWIVLNPRVPPQPGIVRLTTQLASPAARAMLANSITLVPGTMTLDLEGDELTVHVFTPEAIEDLATAAMQTRIAAIFREPPQVRPELVWEAGHLPGGMS